MSVEPLIDLSAIDLNNVALSEDKVGEMNPQAGDMRQLDYVSYLNDEYTIAVGVKKVREDEFWVAGHIPDRPIYPGVLMIEAAAQLSSVLYHIKSTGNHFMGFTRCDNCSFRGQVVPGDTLTLIAVETKFQRRRFICKAQGYVNDTFIFEAQITGMMM
ncbi:MAG: 3-hydroxyacyl-ACP dehydratase FabZ family protein [Phycisphaerales bacterium]|jgi:3-hydroxyacyl-[acyl-carrier-protein] dehydratase|nr:3-hydroxyacyl-ACP dehydratase FabZ family protein [Phycisphaerales bacterium]MDP6692726.1 3-hydroxyacyl-ACP dehydratase FabZ family protein [Phycisphaerales bacterium]